MKILRILGSIALMVTPLAAAERNPEIALFLGYRNGVSLDPTSSRGAGVEAAAAPSWGLSVGWWVRPDGWFEVLFDRQTLEFEPGTNSEVRRFDINVDHLQFGGGYEPPRDGLKPYVTLALGLGRYGSDSGSVSRSAGVSGSIGGGFKVPMGNKALFRLEARGWAILASGSAEVSCGPGCSFTFSGNAWGQIGIRAAVVFCPEGTR